MIWATYLASWTTELGLPKLLGRFIQYENDDYDEKIVKLQVRQSNNESCAEFFKDYLEKCCHCESRISIDI